MYKTEDQVRKIANEILGFGEVELEVIQGTGQITTFNQLGFKGISDKPDGWYLPDNKTLPAIILETKSNKQNLNNELWVAELEKNVNIVLSKYKTCIGILYNGDDIRVFINNIELNSVSQVLENKRYYLRLATNKPIDKMKIYTLTSRINNTLHFNFGIKNLYHRMIFTACALVATRYGAVLTEGMDYSLFHHSILSTLNKSLENSKQQNSKLDLLVEVYSEIRMNNVSNQKAIDDFISWIKDISELINSDNWNGEDVMAIFFNEFNRYKTKSESGQVFTPDHITSFMGRLVDINQDDRVLDAACGSGAFLVKAMSIMIEQSGGMHTGKALKIKTDQLFGVEFDREIFALAAANFLIHKDGKTNLEHNDTRTKHVKEWIKDKKITKVLMNPPFEEKYGCMRIVKNVLDSVPTNTTCAFILPDKKLEKHNGKKLLKNHRLEKIIKLPETTFFGIGMTTSIFIFTSGISQKSQKIFSCYIEEDGLVTVKNQGRQDVYNRWPEIENKWIEIIHKQSGSDTIQWIDPNENLSWQEPEPPFVLYEEDFIKTIMDYEMFKKGIDPDVLKNKINTTVMYNSEVNLTDQGLDIQILGVAEDTEEYGDEN